MFLAQTESQELVDHKWNRLEALNEMLSSMSKEYREIAQQLQVNTSLKCLQSNQYLSKFYSFKIVGRNSHRQK